MVKLNPVNGWAQPHFQWFLNGEELDPDNERIEIVSVGNLRSLRIALQNFNPNAVGILNFK